jgi:hypothetical protein
MRILLALTATALTSCSTTLYSDDGKPLARIQSDVTGLSYQRTADGSVSLTADSLSNSGPVTAIGKALTPAVMAVGAMGLMNATTKTVEAVRAPLLPR